MGHDLQNDQDTMMGANMGMGMEEGHDQDHHQEDQLDNMDHHYNNPTTGDHDHGQQYPEDQGDQYPEGEMAADHYNDHYNQEADAAGAGTAEADQLQHHNDGAEDGNDMQGVEY